MYTRQCNAVQENTIISIALLSKVPPIPPIPVLPLVIVDDNHYLVFVNCLLVPSLLEVQIGSSCRPRDVTSCPLVTSFTDAF